MLEPWPRSWHNLRASRQTELTETFPSHVVASWLGNSERVADKHYLQVLDSHFQKALQKPVQSIAETAGNGSQRDDATKRKTPEITGNQQNSGVFQWAILDSNSRENKLENEGFQKSAAETGAVGDFSRLSELWASLDEDQRRQLLSLAEELAGLERKDRVACGTLDRTGPRQ